MRTRNVPHRGYRARVGDNAAVLDALLLRLHSETACRRSDAFGVHLWLRAMKKRGSSTVNPAVSRITCCARSWRVTSHPFNTGIQDTGSPTRNRANNACGSASSSARVAELRAVAGLLDVELIAVV